MAYTFSNTQGDRTITVNDNQLDQTTYSLTLLGKNVTNYGERIAENTIRQLENFAGPNQPNPTVKLVGQLWYDKTGEHLRVYRGDNADKGFQELAFRPKLLGTSPADNVQNGEMYYDTTSGDLCLKIYNGTAWVNVIATEHIQDVVGAMFSGNTETNLTVTYEDSDGTIDLVLTDATIRSKFTGGTGVTYNSSTGDIAIGQAVETTSNVQFNNLVVDGNLTVNGSQTILNTETLTVDDNLIVLNNNETGTPSANAGIEVERGTSTNTSLRWNETTDRWQFSNDGSAYNNILLRTDFSATDSGGDGSFSYDNSTGVFTYTGPSAAEVRAHFSAGTNTTYSAGSFSISDATIRSKFSVTDSGGDGSLSYSNGVFTYTGPSASEVRAHLSGSSGVNYNSSTGAITGDTAEIRGMFSAGGDLSYNSSTGVFSFTNDAGDIESVTAGVGLSGGGTSGAVTLAVDLNELSSGTLDVTNDRIPFIDSTDQGTKKETVGQFIAAVAGTGLSATGGVLSTDSIGHFSTTDLSEGSNLYFTNTRAISAIATGDVTTQNIVATGPSGTYNVGSSSVKYGTMYANTFSGTASSAQYADLAERYLADADYEVGTVLVFGGSAEVTTTSKQNCPSIAGVVSENPAYLMNSELEGDHVTSVALKGRVPVKVVGRIKKGDVLIHSTTEGHAQAAPFSGYHVTGPCCIGIAISEKADAGAGIVEALVK